MVLYKSSVLAHVSSARTTFGLLSEFEVGTRPRLVIDRIQHGKGIQYLPRDLLRNRCVSSVVLVTPGPSSFCAEKLTVSFVPTTYRVVLVRVGSTTLPSHVQGSLGRMMGTCPPVMTGERTHRTPHFLSLHAVI